MDDRFEGTLAQLRHRFDDALSPLEVGVRDAVLTLLTHELEKVRRPSTASDARVITPALNEKDTYYAIHTTDLNVLKECSVVGASLYSVLNNPIAVLGPLIVLLYSYRRHRVRLDGRQGIVLRQLAKAGSKGLSLDELAANFPLINLSSDEIRSTLESLKDVAKMTGESTALVAESNGRFRAIDV